MEARFEIGLDTNGLGLVGQIVVLESGFALEFKEGGCEPWRWGGLFDHGWFR